MSDNVLLDDIFWNVGVFPEDDDSLLYIYRNRKGEDIEIGEDKLALLADDTSSFIRKESGGKQLAVFLADGFEVELE